MSTIIRQYGQTVMESTSQFVYLNAMGIDVWQPNEKKKKILLDVPSKSEELDWQNLERAVASCVACPLHKTRTQTVFGVGSHQAKLMVIGEAPGFNEDAEGEPFVGRAGQLLNSMLKSIGLAREEIYIANILKCRPPNNRDPQPDEVATCTPFLQKQILLLQPKLLVAVGRIAAHYLLDVKSTLTSLRGKIYNYNNTPLIVTYHPAYLLRNPRDKAKAYQDLQMIASNLHSIN